MSGEDRERRKKYMYIKKDVLVTVEIKYVR